VGHEDANAAPEGDGAVVVRPARPEDAPALSELIAEFNGPQGDAGETAARLVACEGLEVALIAWTPSGAAGFACLRVTPAIGSREPHALLTELYVRAAHRRRGVAGALVRAAEALTLDQGAGALYLFTGRQNVGAQAFYERLGFESRSIVYQKPLAPEPRTPEPPPARC
jgi:GNAT superfamily N-acetyltransferase